MTRARPTSISSTLSRSIRPVLRQRGEAYFLQGRVNVKDSDGIGIWATVRGTRRYTVNLDVEAGVLLCECDCPYFQGNVEPCKHVWAVVLAADEKNLLSTGPTLRNLEPLDLSSEDPGELLTDEEVFMEEDVPHATPLSRNTGSSLAPPRTIPWEPPHVRHQGRTGKRPPAWEMTVEALRVGHQIHQRAQQGFEPGKHEILYMVDLSNTYEQGAPVLEILHRQRLRNGSWGKLRQPSISLAQIPFLPDPVDRRVLTLLQGSEPVQDYGYFSGGEPVLSRVRVAGSIADLIFRELCPTGRCLIRQDGESEAAPLGYDDGEPWRFRLDAESPGGDGPLAVTGRLERGTERISLSQPDLFLASGFFFMDHRVSRLEHGGAFPFIVALRGAGPMEVPRSDGVRFVSEVLAACGDLFATLPGELRFTEARMAPKPFIRILRPPPGRPGYWLSTILSFDYDGTMVEAGAEVATIVNRDRRRLIPRDLDAENSAEAFLIPLGFRRNGSRWRERDATHELPHKHLRPAVPKLLEAGWKVEADGKLYRAPSSFRIEVTSGIDWFELRGGATYDGTEIPLPALLAALKKGDPGITLGDGSLGMLPEEWLRRFAPVAGLGDGKKDHVRFSRAQAGFLDALLASEPEASCDAVFNRVRQKLRTFDGVKAAKAPAGFRGALRPYQKEGLGWLRFLREFGFGGCLADDMGLGKTIQALALLQSRRAARGPRKPSLVVAPRSVIFNWIDESGRFTPRLRVLDHTGLDRTGSRKDLLGHDLIVTTYGTLRQDITLLKGITFDTIILDESQAIKNARTQAAKAVRLLRGDQRIALSGTPIENHLGELWSLFEFLNPGMLGSSGAFQLGARAMKEPDGPARALLSRALRPFILRRTKSQVAPDLPRKTEQTLTCELKGSQRKLYHEILEHYRASLLSRVRRNGLSQSKIQILEALLRLRQAACHPGLLDPKRGGESSAKLDLLFSQLKEILDEGHKALVFSQFTSLLALVKSRLEALGLPYAYLDGSTSPRRRKEAVRRFQEDPGCPLFLISLKAGGLGLNLTAAGYVYLLDPWWNPAVEAQAIDRTHRIGQTRPVFAYRILAAGTIEEKILALQATKRDLADSILSADASVMKSLTRDDLELLLS